MIDFSRRTPAPYLGRPTPFGSGLDGKDIEAVLHEVTCVACQQDLSALAATEQEEATAPVTPCPACGSTLRRTLTSLPAAPFSVGTEGATTVHSFQTGTVKAISRFAGDWYVDAVREAQAEHGDIHSRRREILFAVCCAESYIYEYTYDVLIGALGVTDEVDREIERYFPLKPDRGRNPSGTDQWKAVPRRLRADGHLAAVPDLGGPHGEHWRTLVGYRNGLVHAHLSRPTIVGPSRLSEPTPSVGKLQKLVPGWAAEVAAERIRRLHRAAGTAPPAWLAT